MNILIIEDDLILQKDLAQKLLKADPSISILNKIGSVKESVLWLESNKQPDLIFMDIELSDGVCFDIFDKIQIKCPVIFVTSFNDFALKAFELNGIDYIVKPINEERLLLGLKKYDGLKNIFSNEVFSELKNTIQNITEKKIHLKKRILVYKGGNIIPINPDEIAYIYFEDNVTFVVTNDKKKHIVNYSLDALIEMLDLNIFYRANRQFILSLQAINHIMVYDNNKLMIDVIPTTEKQIIISKDKVHNFKEWLNG